MMGKLNYGSTGVSYECRKVEVATGGAPRCPRCEDRVYFNEERKALGKSWHTRCFTCAKCKKSLSSTNCANHEDEIYCVSCHRKSFGPKGYGFAGGAAGLSSEAVRPSSSYSAPESSSVASRAVPAGLGGEASYTDGDEGNSEKTSSDASTKMVQYPAPSAAAQKFASLSRGDTCPRCNKKVYFAEEVNVRNKKWHKLCFKCETCNKLLEPSRCNEHEGSMYCQACYGKKYGPKGYGFSGGMGTMMTSESSRALANRTNVPHRSQSTTDSPVKTQPITGSLEWTEPVRM